MAVDIILVVLLVAGFVVGFFRGAVRQLLALGAWLIAFALAAHLRPALGEWLGAQWVQYSLPYVEMLSFGIVFVFLFVLGFAIAQFTGGRTTLTRLEWVDDILGGLLGLGLVLLVAATVFVILTTVYAAGPPATGEDVRALRDLHAALRESAIIGQMRESLLPGLGAILGFFLPSDVRVVMG